MTIGGMRTDDRSMTIEANFPYKGLVDLICKGWQGTGFARDFHPPQADYLVKVTIK